MANYQNKGIIIQRFNDAIRDLLQADLASQNNETNRSKHLRDAGEAISQTIEWALKHHLNLYLPVAKRINPNDRISIKTLLDYYANPFYRSKTCDV